VIDVKYEKCAEIIKNDLKKAASMPVPATA